MKHHPSCKPSDVSLVYQCAQCGETCSASTNGFDAAAAIEAYPRLVEALRQMIEDLGDERDIGPKHPSYATRQSATALLRELGEG